MWWKNIFFSFFSIYWEKYTLFLSIFIFSFNQTPRRKKRDMYTGEGETVSANATILHDDTRMNEILNWKNTFLQFCSFLFRVVCGKGNNVHIAQNRERENWRHEHSLTDIRSYSRARFITCSGFFFICLFLFVMMCSCWRKNVILLGIWTFFFLSSARHSLSLSRPRSYVYYAGEQQKNRTKWLADAHRRAKKSIKKNISMWLFFALI
jgi:hypothetical protein